MDKLIFTAWFEVNRTIDPRDIIILICCGAFVPRAPRLIRVKSSCLETPLFYPQLPIIPLYFLGHDDWSYKF